MKIDVDVIYTGGGRTSLLRVCWLGVLAIYLSIGVFYSVWAQEVQSEPQVNVIEGILSFPDGSPIVGANVLARVPADSTIITYSVTNVAGQYKLVLPWKYNEILITITSISTEPKALRIKNESQRLDLQLKEHTTMLKELNVVPPKVRASGDTISYSVLQLGAGTDRTIKDILRKIPGVKVEHSGEISVQGKPITRLYIEGIDLTQGQYVQLTEGLKKEDVSSVQILYNHEHVKALQNTRRSNDIAINLRMSEKRQGVWSFNPMVGIGYGDRLNYDAKLFTSYITKRNQHLVTGRIENVGLRATKDLHRFGQTKGIAPGDLLSSMVLLAKANIGYLRSNYYLDNLSGYASENSSFAIGKDTQLNINLSFLSHAEQMQEDLQTEYHHPNGTTERYQENLHTESHTDAFSSELDLEHNASSLYFNDHLSFYLSKEYKNGKNILVDSPKVPIDEHFEFASYQIKNRLRYIRLSTAIPVEFSATQEWKSGEEIYRFNPTPDSSEPVLQVLPHRHFIVTNLLSTPDFSIGKGWRYTPNVAANYQHYTLDEVADHQWVSSSAHKFTYIDDKTNLSLSLPLLYLSRRIGETGEHYFSVEPHLFVKRKLSYKWETELGLSYGTSMPSFLELYPARFYSDYKTLQENELILYHKGESNASLKVIYNDFMNLLSSYLLGRLLLQSSPYLDAFKYEGNQIRRTLVPHQNDLLLWEIKSSVSKGIDFWNLSTTVDVGYNTMQGKSVLQGEIKAYKSRTASADLRLVLSPLKYITLQYDAEYSFNRYLLDGQTTNRSHLMGHKGKLFIEPAKSWNIGMEVDHTYLRTSYNSGQVTLLGAFFTLNTGASHIAIEVNNLLNERHYTTFSNQSYASTIHSYLLRPRSVMLRYDVTF